MDLGKNLSLLSTVLRKSLTVSVTRIVIDELPGDVLDRVRPVRRHLLFALPLTRGRVRVQRGRRRVSQTSVGHQTYLLHS